MFVHSLGGDQAVKKSIRKLILVRDTISRFFDVSPGKWSILRNFWSLRVGGTYILADYVTKKFPKYLKC